MCACVCVSYFISIFRLSWITSSGYKYENSEFVLYDWQADDLPVFGKIVDLLYINNTSFLLLASYTTIGLYDHFDSFVIEPNSLTQVVDVNNIILTYHPPVIAYSFRSKSHCLYISLKFHVLKQ